MATFLGALSKALRSAKFFIKGSKNADKCRKRKNKCLARNFLNLTSFDIFAPNFNQD